MAGAGTGLRVGAGVLPGDGGGSRGEEAGLLLEPVVLGGGDDGSGVTTGLAVALGEAPGEAGDAPGETGDAPGETGDVPGAAGEAPGDTGGAPGETGDAPDDAGDDTGDAPGDTGDAPGDTGDAPGDTGEAPGDTGGAPGETGEGPGDTGDAPGEAPGDDRGDAPGDTGGAPGEVTRGVALGVPLGGGGGLRLGTVPVCTSGVATGVGEATPLVLVGMGVPTAGLGPRAGAGTGAPDAPVGGARGEVTLGVGVGESLLGDPGPCKHQEQGVNSASESASESAILTFDQKVKIADAPQVLSLLGKLMTRLS